MLLNHSIVAVQVYSQDNIVSKMAASSQNYRAEMWEF